MKNEMHILCSSSKSDLPGKLLIVGQPIHGIRFSTYRPDTFAVVCMMSSYGYAMLTT